ncbi:A.superbus venom factor 1-like [Pseudophryne corroboree]|uniref:A.superbus venom factor 1-like n=1 Tax=Pseudophryne corroboree TaxID=495146 RepID=UPI003081F9F2
MGCRGLCLVLLALLAGSYAQPCALITPNILHLESEETIVVDGHSKQFEANVEIQEFPKRNFILAKEKISVNSNNKFLGTAKITIPAKELLKDQKSKQYVYVSVKAPGCNIEKLVLVGYQSGYIFIQTDKTIYTPGSTVLYRIYSMNYKMSPINKAVVIEFLTPDNIIVKRDTVRQDGGSGILSLSYNMPELVSVGTWTISAKYEDSPLQNYTTNFEVKEYVLPTFEIQLIPEQSFFYANDAEFRVDIKAKYLYGKDVDGMAYVIFGVKKDDVRTSLTHTLRRTQITNGEGEAELKREDILKIFKNEDDILEYTLYVSVTLITGSGSEMVQSELENIYIVKSPYKILFTKTSKYFKPGMPFDLTVFVTNPDGSPANRIPVIAEPGKVVGMTSAEGTVRLTLNTASTISVLPITVKTDRPDLPPNRQASATTTVTAYKSNGNYLHIGITAAEVKPGVNLQINFNIRNTNLGIQNQIQHFTYLIMNKGRILKTERQPRLAGQPVVTLSLPITEQFLPSFRIIAYYIVGNEIVSDSVWVDVTDSCMGTLEVSGNTDRDNGIQSPSTSLKLKLRADHKSSVGLVAVDKGVFVLNSKFKISQSKVWNLVEKSDIGCTPGSGANNMAVFYDAGLALQSSIQLTTQDRSDAQCAVRAARKRRSSVQLIEQKATYASKYKDAARRCCNDGMVVNPMGHSCEKRARHILDGKECVDAFLDCCSYFEKIRAVDEDKEVDPFARSDEDIDYMDSSEFQSRSEFPESWFWKIEQMTERPDNNGISSKVLNVFLKDSITTWEVLAVSLSENKGICVAKPYEIRVMKDFFIDLKLPYSVVRNEQVEIRAILYNYGSTDIKVRAELLYNEKFCSLATAKSPFRQTVEVSSHSSYALSFIIVPLELGTHDVEVKASVFQKFVSDGVRKKLKVVPEGNRITTNIKSVTLEPRVKGIDGVQEEKIDPLDVKNIVPGTRIETVVTIQGNSVTTMVEEAIEGSNLNPLIVVPRGCGEQNMITMTPSVIATVYLDVTGQWEKVGVDKRNQAINNIKQGYIQQLVYRKVDNSYAAFKDRPASTWLTAYVAKVFGMAQTLMDVDNDVLCGAIKWLILQKQKPDGLFKEDAPVIHQEMVGGLKGSNEADSALTAFVLIAMLESEKTCTAHVNNLKMSIEMATSFLLGQYPNLKKPYTIAIVTYALAKAGIIDNANKLLSATTDKLHWEEPGSRFITLEATSYALLALLQLKEFELTGPIVRWINEQRYYGAVYGSTQATIVMFQALAQYQIDIPSINELDLDVSLHLPQRNNPLTYRINFDNAMLSRSAETNVNRQFAVTARGKGQGTLTVMSVYHALETEKEKKCTNFDLSVKVTEELNVRVNEGILETVSIEICARYKKDVDATMSILDVSMMTGFTPDVDSLNKLMKGVDKYISKFEINKESTEKGTLVIYLDKVSHTEDECIKFAAHQIFKVGLIQPASVTVYDYYTPENRCTKFYHLEEGNKLLGRICQGEVCRCAEDNCFMQQHIGGKKTNAKDRIDRACRPGVDYVFKARLDKIEYNENYDNYVMFISNVIKEGTDANVEKQQRNFISHTKCRKALDMKEGRDYLIWGVTSDLWLQPSGYSYIIGRETWMEWWPNNRECQMPGNVDLCEDFFIVSEELELTGCPS